MKKQRSNVKNTSPYHRWGTRKAKILDNILCHQNNMVPEIRPFLNTSGNIEMMLRLAINKQKTF